MQHRNLFTRPRVAMVRLLAPAVLTVTACLGAVEAKATVVVGAFSGVINYGRDYGGMFGAAGATLDGLRYTGTFTYDTSKGTRLTSANGDQVSANGVLNMDPVLTYALTINGITDQIDVSAISFVAILSSHEFRLGGQSGAGADSVTVAEVADGAPFDNLDAPHSFADTVNGLGSPYFGVVQRFRNFTQAVYYVNFDTERVDLLSDGVASGAPEPVTWGMMLAGFFAVGAALRGRKVAPSH